MGSCVVDPFYNTFKYGPGIEVTIICGEIIDTVFEAQAVLSARSLNSTAEAIDEDVEKKPQGEMDAEALKVYGALKARLSNKASSIE
jgi:hypothetical protein